MRQKNRENINGTRVTRVIGSIRATRTRTFSLLDSIIKSNIFTSFESQTTTKIKEQGQQRTKRTKSTGPRAKQKTKQNKQEDKGQE